MNAKRGSREGAKSAKEDAKKKAWIKMDIFEFRERKNSGVSEEIEQLAARAIGAAIEVHRRQGPGLPESSYRRALSRELDLRGIRHACEVPVPIFYKDVEVGLGRIDILVEDKLVLELKAVESLTKIHVAQTVSYLNVMRLPLALLINFNVMILKDGIKRVVSTR